MWETTIVCLRSVLPRGRWLRYVGWGIASSSVVTDSSELSLGLIGGVRSTRAAETQGEKAVLGLGEESAKRGKFGIGT